LTFGKNLTKVNACHNVGGWSKTVPAITGSGERAAKVLDTVRKVA